MIANQGLVNGRSVILRATLNLVMQSHPKVSLYVLVAGSSHKDTTVYDALLCMRSRVSAKVLARELTCLRLGSTYISTRSLEEGQTKVKMPREKSQLPQLSG